MSRGPVDILKRFVPDPAPQMEAVDATTVTFTMKKPNFHPDSAGSAGSNSMFYGSEEVGKLLNQARDAATEEELVEATGQILQIMIQDDPAAIFYAQTTRAKLPRHDIRGFRPNGIYIASHNFHEMWREAT
jgi:peptide/nickel transport system substrate-binding protein